jgi:hypothetical protein
MFSDVLAVWFAEVSKIYTQVVHVFTFGYRVEEGKIKKLARVGENG